MSLDLTESAMKKFASNCEAMPVAAALAAACAEYTIDTARRLTHFLGHTYHESNGFTRLHENLDYRAERLMAVWPKRFPTLQKAAPYAHNPPALANYVYGGRLGNTAPEDGWRYRGRGFIQLTGKDNYRAASKWSGLKLIEHPEQAAEFDGAARIAAAFWVDRGLNTIAELPNEGDAIRQETKLINGGWLGLAERRSAITRAAAIWS